MERRLLSLEAVSLFAFFLPFHHCNKVTTATMSSGATTKSRYFRQTPRKWLLRILAVLFVCLGIFHLVQFLASPPSKPSSHWKRGHGKQGQAALQVKRGDWCTEKEYLDGEWVKRDGEVTLDRLREIYKYTVRPLPLSFRR